MSVENSGRRATSMDVANESGVSQATVTRVFSSPELVAPKTQAKVHAAAARLGYVPNAIARSLKSQRTNMIGAVVPAEGEYWQHALTAFSRQLAAQDRQLLLFSFGEDDRVEQVLESVLQYQLDGVVLASAKISQAQLSVMQAQRVPTVAFNQPEAAGVVPSISVDNEAGTRALAAHLVEDGCRSALFIGGIATTSTDRLRYQGAARGLGEHGIGCAYLEAGSFSYEAGYFIAEEVVALLAEGGSIGAGRARPSALMVSGDELAFGVLDGLRSRGVRVPDDVLLTGFDGLPQASWAGYDLTTIVQDIDLLVQRAVEILLDQEDRTVVPELVADGALRIGSTTRRSRG
ncbi:MAG: LacI family DNA-binding transcriptional regulator [Actinomycetota bacterium]